MSPRPGFGVSIRMRMVWAIAALALCSGCAGARAYQREHLASRIMNFKTEAREEARSTKALEAREGSTGGNGGAGGGCACN